jgi:riboflavin synthase
MFTGIISHMGKLVSLNTAGAPELVVAIDFNDQPINIGDSIAVNGACLTLVEEKDNQYLFNLSRESLKLANFSDLTKGSHLNIELPLRMQDFLGGHLVSGHLDGTVRLKGIVKRPGSTRLSFVYQQKDWRKYLIHKGSVTLNGVSLTIAEVTGSLLAVEVIPHTWATTNLQWLRSGERVNLELDLIAKYLYNLSTSKG